MLAVDLSLASLCYAKRQALALGLTNIAFGEADILKLGGIGRTFDIVDASGVLHHMADPWAGWRVLPLLRPGGFMRVGLYSRLGRRDVDAGAPLLPRRPAPTAHAFDAADRVSCSFRQGSWHEALPSISTSSPSANAATCSSMCRSIK